MYRGPEYTAPGTSVLHSAVTQWKTRRLFAGLTVAIPTSGNWGVTPLGLRVAELLVERG